MKKQIFLDMDGVIVDWDAGVRKKFGVDWHPTEWEIPYEEVFNRSENSFWYMIDYSKFWAELPWTKDGKEIYELVKSHDPCILTIARCQGALLGKGMWLRRNIPEVGYSGRYFIAGGMKKHLLAHPNSILIDDCDALCDEWENSGGKVILYPRPWNRNHVFSNPLNYLKAMLRKYV
jgi:hypothetical protein